MLFIEPTASGVSDQISNRIYYAGSKLRLNNARYLVSCVGSRAERGRKTSGVEDEQRRVCFLFSVLQGQRLLAVRVGCQWTEERVTAATKVQLAQ